MQITHFLLLRHCLNTLEIFLECSGLKLNIEKNKDILDRKHEGFKEAIPLEKNLNWEIGKLFVVRATTFSADLK